MSPIYLVNATACEECYMFCCEKLCNVYGNTLVKKKRSYNLSIVTCLFWVVPTLEILLSHDASVLN